MIRALDNSPHPSGRPTILSFEAFAARVETVGQGTQQGDDKGKGPRLGLLTARRFEDGLALVAVLLDLDAGAIEVIETPLPANARGYPSFTPRVPQAHWFERAIHDFFGLVPEGHPRFKDLILHEAWPADFFPLRDAVQQAPSTTAPRRSYAFLEVTGEGVYEIPVGPIHAGIIEPGHFRFSCLGEIIQNLEIRLGYQHRGVEQRLTEVPWHHARFHAESASSDTAVGNALAHARAMEAMMGIKLPMATERLRMAALEIERVACHLGDMGGICNDIGFAGGASIFGRLRGQALGLGERLSGARFLTGYVRPCGVLNVPSREDAAQIARDLDVLRGELERAVPLILDNPSALDRMEGIGRVRPTLARDFGLVGPAGRASGMTYDVRTSMTTPEMNGDLHLPPIPTRTSGDVLARVEIRVDEMWASLDMLGAIVQATDTSVEFADLRLPERLPVNACGVGLVEAWRGELIHLVFSDSLGRISRYAIKDPSFNNWTGLAIAARGELVSDFPLCNKSFSLSYSGNDL